MTASARAVTAVSASPGEPARQASPTSRITWLGRSSALPWPVTTITSRTASRGGVGASVRRSLAGMAQRYTSARGRAGGRVLWGGWRCRDTERER